MSRRNEGPRLGWNKKTGYFEIRWTDPQPGKKRGRSRRLSTGKTSRTAATLFLAGWLQQVEEDAKLKEEPLRVSALLDMYELEYAAEKMRNKDRIKYAAAPIRAFFGEMRADKIDDGKVTEYCRARRGGRIGRPVADGTIRVELAYLSAALGYAARNSSRTKLTKAARPTIPLPPKGPPRDRVATEAELDRMMEAAEWAPVKGSRERRLVQPERLTRIYRFLALARWTAARKEAIETLQWGRINFDAGLIDLRDPLIAETKKRRVPVPIDPRLLPILRRAWEEKTSLYVLDHPRAIRKAWEMNAARAGLPDITPHVLRHSWATHAAARGVSLWKIAAFLGDTVQTVERNYAHRSPEYLRDVFDGAHSGAHTRESGA